MSSSGTLSGRRGMFMVNDYRIAKTTEWNVNPALAHTSEWGDSDSHGYTSRLPGRKDCKFSAQGKYDENDEVFDIFEPGDLADAALFMDTGLYWAFRESLNLDFKLAVNIDTEEVIGWTSDWGADGKYYYPGQSGATSYEISDESAGSYESPSSSALH